MLICETAGGTPQDVEDLAVFASQLGALGLDARIAASAVPGLIRNVRFDLAPFLTDRPLGPDDRLVLLAAHRLGDDRLMALRRHAREAPVRTTVIGAFSGRQSVLGTQARLSYVLGADPEIVDLGPVSATGKWIFGVPARQPAPAGPMRLLLLAPPLEEPAAGRALLALALSSRLAVSVLASAEQKQCWTEAHGTGIPFFQFGEILPVALAARTDLCVAFAALPTSYRTRSLLANVIAGGGILIDGTSGHELAATLDAAVPGPPDVASLAAFLADRIVPNRARLEAQTRASRAAASFEPAPLLAALGVPDAEGGRRRRGEGPAEGRVVFMPTNGVGLGHAQRCAQIAGVLRQEGIESTFAAFPGCMGLVKSYGFDVMPLVSRSGLHALPYENDLPNYLRLRALVEGARGLVFDGGYIFDSVFRTALERAIPAVWIRRGLWQTGQDNTVALDREKAFARVIVPGEAFPELNRSYSRGEHIHTVPPILGMAGMAPDRRAALRADIAERFGQPFERLVVSLLGAGVAADRGAQIQALCGMIERRPDTLHLVVVWPAAVLQPAWFNWRRTRVVKTRRAATLAAASDLLVAAAGYNTFHEVLYGALPTVFIPQMGAFMDDQRARAQAAVARDLAVMVEPTNLVTLDRLVERMLDGDAEGFRARLKETEFPAPGNAAAARLVSEVLRER